MSTSPKRTAPSPGPDDLAADSNKRIKLNVSAASPSSPAGEAAEGEATDALQELEPDKAPGKDKEKVPIDSGNLGNISNGMDGAEPNGRQGGEC